MPMSSRSYTMEAFVSFTPSKSCVSSNVFVGSTFMDIGPMRLMPVPGVAMNLATKYLCMASTDGHASVSWG
ncbi:hypothetical protein D3C85_1811230 [compost metagenome]